MPLMYTDLDSVPLADDLLSQISGPVAWGYGRVSHRKSLQGDSLDAQRDRTTAYWDFRLKAQGIRLMGFLPEPRDVSAYSRRFEDRPAGKYLMTVLRKGDHLIVDKIDRLWRTISDFAGLMQYFQAKGIVVHFVNLMGATVELGTPMGDFTVGLMVLVAQLESAMKSDRLKAMHRHAEEHGLWKRKYCPPGCRIVGKNRNRRLTWNWEERRLLGEIVRLRTQERMGFRAISDIIERRQCEIEGRKFYSLRRVWTHKRCCFAYICELHYRLVKHPSEVPWRRIARMRLSEADSIARRIGLSR